MLSINTRPVQASAGNTVYQSGALQRSQIQREDPLSYGINHKYTAEGLWDISSIRAPIIDSFHAWKPLSTNNTEKGVK